VRRSLSNASPPEAKTSAFQNGVLAALEPNPAGAYEDLFLDMNGYVTEVRIGNLFIVDAHALLTPPTAGILNGITRRVVIECARRAGIPVREVPLTRHDVYNAREAFLTNTSWEILPVSSLDGRKIGGASTDRPTDGPVPGPVTAKLHRIFKQKVAQECRRKPHAARS
jgi:branched-chain amino acid aminotransferase